MARPTLVSIFKQFGMKQLKKGRSAISSPLCVYMTNPLRLTVFDDGALDGQGPIAWPYRGKIQALTIPSVASQVHCRHKILQYNGKLEAASSS
ncbi:hypothetical protein RJ641_001755 [Dillenia turbinata]|uniref:Uncharacterized protein n=1 Tax=Dillenia turbinata TaxID=194707 RepID=A0AAN8ZBJ6_9MAGN